MPYTDDQLLMVVRDVTQMRQLEGARRNFFANTSPELRTPLTVLQEYLEMITDDSLDAHMRQRAVKTMQDQSRRMERLVAQLLELSRIEAAPQGKPTRRWICRPCSSVCRPASRGSTKASIRWCYASIRSYGSTALKSNCAARYRICGRQSVTSRRDKAGPPAFHRWRDRCRTAARRGRQRDCTRRRGAARAGAAGRYGRGVPPRLMA